MKNGKSAKEVIREWPKDQREVAQQVVDKYGEPDEMTPTVLLWYDNGPWLKTVVENKATKHVFPMPHTDIVEQFVGYEVPPEKLDELAEFDGSVAVKRTEGLFSARCHDEAANFLALNLAHDIIEDKLTVNEAREKYVQSLKDFRMKKPTPYMEGLKFKTMTDAGDSGEQMISKDELESYRID